MSIDKSKLKSFEAWLCSCGAEILPQTNPYELLRFRAKCGTGVIYEGKRGLSVSNSLVEEAYQCFKNGIPWKYKGKPTKRIKGSKHKRELIDRDGPFCFYCGEEFGVTELTQEHLVAIAHKGPDRLENKVLACQPCNLEADKLPVIEKVKMRDAKRQQNI